jgi:cation transport ATPase
MNKSKATRLIIQGVGACFGILGLIWVCMGICFAVAGIRDSDLFGMFFMTPMFLILGGIVLAVAWQAVRHFGPNAIKNVVALVAFSAYCVMSLFPEPPQEVTRDLKGKLYLYAAVFVPMLLAFLLYRVLSRKLIEMTGADASHDGLNHAGDPRERDSTSA